MHQLEDSTQRGMYAPPLFLRHCPTHISFPSNLLPAVQQQLLVSVPDQSNTIKMLVVSYDLQNLSSKSSATVPRVLWSSRLSYWQHCPPWYLLVLLCFAQSVSFLKTCTNTVEITARCKQDTPTIEHKVAFTLPYITVAT